MDSRKNGGVEKSSIIDLIDKSDVVIEVVDSRFVSEARVTSIEKLISSKGKKFIIVVNKIDLVPTRFILDIKGYLNREKFKDETKSLFGFCIMSAKHRLNTKSLWSLLNRFVLKSGKSKIKVAVIGLPNSGKSSIINILKGKHSAKTSPLPGLTKSEQFVRISKKILLIDSPGVIDVRGDDAVKVLLCSYPIDKVNYNLACNFLSLFVNSNIRAWPALKSIYKIKIQKRVKPEFILEEIATNLNFKLKGGLLDLNRAAKKLVSDWYSGKLNFYWIKRKETKK